MKIFNKIATIGLLATVGLVGCKKSFLDQKPTDQIATEDVFKNIEGMESAIQGIHRTMYEYGGETNLFGYPSIALMWDLMGEDMVLPDIGSGWFITAYRYNDARDPSSTGAYAWTFFYRQIHNANMILANLGNIPATYQDRKDYVEASAKFYRAFCYYNLAVCYMHTYAASGDVTAPVNYSGPFRNAPCVPIYLTPTKVGNPRATVAQVYALIEKDLSEAIALFDGTSVTRTDKSEIDGNVARGIYARVALTEQKWSVAEQMAMAARQGYDYMTAKQALDGFSDIKNPEWMWGSIINSEQNSIYASFLSQMDLELGGYAQSQQKCLSTSLFNGALDTAKHDVRRNWWVGRYEKIAFPEKFQYYRQQGQRKFRGQIPTSFMGDFPLMRAGEMALIEAEAKAQQNKVADAATVLNDFVRTRRPSYNAPTGDAMALIDSIRIQRRIELWGEGFRYADLKREFAPSPRGRQNVTGLARGAAGGHNPGIAVEMTITPFDRRFNFRIPGSELNNNTDPGMMQNP